MYTALCNVQQDDSLGHNWILKHTDRIEGTERHDTDFGRDLIKQYGPLLSINQLATLLDRSPDVCRITLRSSGEWVSKINATRLRLGRRVYFRTAEVANVLGIR